MEIKIIKNKKQHKAYLSEVEKLMDKGKRSSLENDRLQLLALIIEHYEKKAFPIAKPSPSEAIKFRMDQLNIKQKDLIPYIPSRSHISEILNRKRALSLQMIRKLHEGLGISLDVLIQKEI